MPSRVLVERSGRFSIEDHSEEALLKQFLAGGFDDFSKLVKQKDTELVAKRIAELRGITLEEVENITSTNAKVPFLFADGRL